MAYPPSHPTITADVLAKLLKSQNALKIRLQNKPDGKALEEEQWAENQHKATIAKEKARKLTLENDFAQGENDARKSYGIKVFWLMVVWLSAVFVLVILSGIPILEDKKYFHLSENIVLALIGTTTLNVIGLFGFVMKYLFSPKKA